jgi:hypothetical protein
MLRFRLLLSAVFALGTLFVSSLYTFAYYHIIPEGLSKDSAIIAIILSIIAFVLCIRIKSYAVGGLLTLGGILMQIPPVQAIISVGTIAVPGPILGVIFFCPVLILGLVKLARSTTTPAATAATIAVSEKKNMQSKESSP